MVARNELSLTNTVRRRSRSLGIESVEAYVDAILGSTSKRSSTGSRLGSRIGDGNGSGVDADERRRLIDAVTVGETSFFRTPTHFEWFADVFLPNIKRASRGEAASAPIRVWSAACSTGAEPYTLAMLAASKMPSWSDSRLEVIASDLSSSAIEACQRAEYGPRLVAGVPAALQRRYLEAVPGTDRMRVVRTIRQRVQFVQHNLMHPVSRSPLASFCPFDCVFLRNVLIYFDAASKMAVLRHLAAALKPGGYLVVGPSEGLFGLDHGFEKRSTFLYQKP